MWKLQDTYHDGTIARATIINEEIKDTKIVLETLTQPDLESLIKYVLERLNS